MPNESSAALVVEKGIPDLKIIPLERQVCVPGAWIRDLDSKNGNFVNGARLSAEG